MKLFKYIHNIFIITCTLCFYEYFNTKINFNKSYNGIQNSQIYNSNQYELSNELRFSDSKNSNNFLNNQDRLQQGAQSEANSNTGLIYQTGTYIPVAAGIGGEVIISCLECKKIMSAFVERCFAQEAAGQSTDTFRAFCEYHRTKPSSLIHPDTCLLLNRKLASVAGESGSEIVDPTKPPFECSKYRSQCDSFGGPPQCYSGFCEMVAECIDCPSANVMNEHFGLVSEVCAGNGICRLGFKYPDSKGGNGYCECLNSWKGLSCNQK